MENISFSNEKEVIYALYGLVLGDGHYQKKGDWIKITHTNKQRFYCTWLCKICEKNKIKYSATFDFIKSTTFGEYEYSEVRIKSPNPFYFVSQNKIFNEKGKKTISEYVMNNINILGLLFWYLDDGSLCVHKKKDGSVCRFAYLNTQGFTKEENQKIQKMFKERFDIDTRLHIDVSGINKNKYYRIYFNATNFRKFFDLVRPFLNKIPKEFYYKFNMKYYPNRLKNSLELSQKYNLI